MLSRYFDQRFGALSVEYSYGSRPAMTRTTLLFTLVSRKFVNSQGTTSEANFSNVSKKRRTCLSRVNWGEIAWLIVMRLRPSIKACVKTPIGFSSRLLLLSLFERRRAPVGLR